MPHGIPNPPYRVLPPQMHWPWNRNRIRRVSRRRTWNSIRMPVCTSMWRRLANIPIPLPAAGGMRPLSMHMHGISVLPPETPPPASNANAATAGGRPNTLSLQMPGKTPPNRTAAPTTAPPPPPVLKSVTPVLDQEVSCILIHMSFNVLQIVQLFLYSVPFTYVLYTVCRVLLLTSNKIHTFPTKYLYFYILLF